MSETVTFHKLTYNRRGEDWVVAYEPTGSYALINEEGKQIITDLQQYTIETTQKKHPFYDVKEFIQELKEQGLIYKQNHHVVDHKKHLTDLLDIPKKYLRWTQHPLTKGAVLGIILTGIYILLTNPQLTPGPSWLYATTSNAALIPTIILTMFAISALHELGHYATLKATGHATGIQLLHRWYFLRPRVNLNNAQLLTRSARNNVYLAGIAVDLLILTTALLIVAHTANPYAKLVAVLSFLHALGQFTPHKEADLMRVASHQAGVADITTHFSQAIKSMCIFCNQPKNQDFHRHAAPLLILSTIVLAIILGAYAIPFIGAITLAAATNLLTAATNLQATLFTDSLVALLLLSITAAYTATAQLRDHKHNKQLWFKSLMTALFALSTFTTTLLLSVAITTYADTATALTTHLVLGVLYGTLLINYTKHFQLHEYHIPLLTLLTATLLLATLAWYTTATLITAPVASYTVIYTVGVLASSLL